MVFCFANHAFWYVVVYPSALLMYDIKAGTKVDGSFSITMWILLLVSIYDSFAWSCEIDEFEHVWGSWSFLISHYLLARTYDALYLQAQLLSSQMTISFVGFDNCVLWLASLIRWYCCKACCTSYFVRKNIPSKRVPIGCWTSSRSNIWPYSESSKLDS